MIDVELKDALDLILEKVTDLDQKVTRLETKVTNLEKGQKELAFDVQMINIRLENTVEPRIQLIYENQTKISDQNKRLTVHDHKIENIETDTFALKYAFKALKQE